METFWQWLAQLKLIETYYGLDPAAYNSLFDAELERLIARTSDPAHREALERMRGFRWLSYVAASVRNSGYRDQREIQEKAHDIVVKLLMGTLFRGFDETKHGEFDRRFRNSVGNAIRNLVELERNRRHYLPTVPIQQEFQPGGVTADDLPDHSPAPNDHDERLIQGFRNLVWRRLGGIGVAVLDVRLAGGEMKSLVGCKDLGSPGKWVVKKTVQEIKELAREYARSLGDPAFLHDIEKAMGREEATIEKRRASMKARQGVGA